MSLETQQQIPDGAPEDAPPLHFNTFVYDFSPLGEPIILTQATEHGMQEAIEAGANVGGILRAMADARNAALESGQEERDEVARVWLASGVNAVEVTLGASALNPSDWNATLRDIAFWNRRARAGDDMVICRSADELELAAGDGKVGIVLGMQDSTQIGTDLDKLDMLHDFGVRVMQLTFNTRNLIGDGCTEREQSGLSRYGLEVVKRFNELGIVVDVSHSGNGTRLDAIEHSEKPIAFTHVSCQGVAEHSRAATDEQLRALGESDGYVGIVAVPFFLAPDGGASVDDVARHVEHAAAIVGVERVGIGTDWGLWSPDFPQAIKDAAHQKLIVKHGKFSKRDVPSFDVPMGGLEGWETWSNITGALLKRGFSEQDTAGVVGGNWLSYLRRIGL
jgi:membrane dipeptidase